MPLVDSLIGPIASIIDKLIPDKAARDKAKLELLQLQGTQELAEINARLSAIVAEANSQDPWTSRARPSFLYVVYLMLLWALPMGVIAAFRPEAAQAIAHRAWTYVRGQRMFCHQIAQRHDWYADLMRRREALNAEVSLRIPGFTQTAAAKAQT